MPPEVSAGALRELAGIYGLETGYEDISGRHREASPETLLRVLKLRGAPLERAADAPGALREARREHWERVVEPVMVVWDGREGRAELRLPAGSGSAEPECFLVLESGERRRVPCPLDRLPVARSAEVGGRRYLARLLPLPGPLPSGYHRLVLERNGERTESLLISAPRASYRPDGETGESRRWGVFLPLYALRSKRDWGAGDFTDLERLTRWTAGLGGDFVGTLPLLASFLDEPFDPSPYAPVSRLFWNELYVDVTRAPPGAGDEDGEGRRDAVANGERPGVGGAGAQQTRVGKEVRRMRSLPLVDYRGLARLKREVLEERGRRFFGAGGNHADSFERFLEENPRAEEYARFRAVGERRREPWPEWPARLRNGAPDEGDYDPAAERYHLYAQWLAERQMEALTGAGEDGRSALYLDLPLGAHPAGYDVWRERDLFARGASVGAPPDDFFAEGQDWGFPPPDPRRMRETGYGHTIDCLRHSLRHAGALRIDHVMSLHRLYWVPRGADAKEGVYVRYRPEELYAILTLESHRQRTRLVGEDLGTVPAEVREAMVRHRVDRLYVMAAEIRPDPQRPLPPVPRDSLASLDTHDHHPFAAFWSGRDIEERRAVGLLDRREAWRERGRREELRAALTGFLAREGRLEEGFPREGPGPDTEDGGRDGRDDDRDGEGGPQEGPGLSAPGALRGCLRYLSASPARTVMVNLEDLWLETRPQNLPGTGAERPNWRRKARFSLEEFGHRSDVVELLREVDRLRGAGGAGGAGSADGAVRGPRRGGADAGREEGRRTEEGR